VIGAGAIGGTLAAQMALAGHEVAVLARGAHLAAIVEDGLRFNDLAGQTHQIRLRAAQSAEALARMQGVPDLLVLAVKAHAIAPLASTLPALMGPRTVVVPAINGLPWWYFDDADSRREGRAIRCLDPHGAIARTIDPARILGCVVYVAAEISAAGVVTHTASRKMVLGEPSGQISDRALRLAGCWNEAGFETRVSANIRQEIWSKLLGNLSFNPICALTGHRSDKVLQDPALVDIIRAMIDEGRSVALAAGVDPAIPTEARIEAARAIGSARPSTLQDFELGRRPEVEGLMGSVLELADRLKVPVPTIRQIHALLCARARHLGLLAEASGGI
jgi:2-dehydropantoate 2-reductase